MPTIAIKIGARLSLLFVAVLSPQAVFGGAWTLPQGTGQVVVTDTASQATQAFGSGGKLSATPRYRKEELQLGGGGMEEGR